MPLTLIKERLEKAQEAEKEMLGKIYDYLKGRGAVLNWRDLPKNDWLIIHNCIFLNYCLFVGDYSLDDAFFWLFMGTYSFFLMFLFRICLVLLIFFWSSIWFTLKLVMYWVMIWLDEEFLSNFGLPGSMDGY